MCAEIYLFNAKIMQLIKRCANINFEILNLSVAYFKFNILAITK